MFGESAIARYMPLRPSPPAARTAPGWLPFHRSFVGVAQRAERGQLGCVVRALEQALVMSHDLDVTQDGEAIRGRRRRPFREQCPDESVGFEQERCWQSVESTDLQTAVAGTTWAGEPEQVLEERCG